MAERVDPHGQRQGPRRLLGTGHGLGVGAGEEGEDVHHSWTPFSGLPSSPGPVPQTGFYGWDPLRSSPLSPTVSHQQSFGMGGPGVLSGSHSPGVAFSQGQSHTASSDASLHSQGQHYAHGGHGLFNSHVPLGASQHLVHSHFSSPLSATERGPFSPGLPGDGLDFHYGHPSDGWMYSQEPTQRASPCNVSFYPEYPYPSGFGQDVGDSPVSVSPEPQDSLPDDFPQSPQSGISHFIPDVQNSVGRETLNSFPEGLHFSSVYTPFGSQEVRPDNPVPEERIETMEPVSAKPSYSDVAKTVKARPSQKIREESVYSDASSIGLMRQRSVESSLKSGKPSSKQGAGHGKSRGQTMEASLEATVQPDSKYGLDSFESVDTRVLRGEEVLSGSVESLTETGRKGSISSVGSSATSGGEEPPGVRSLHLGRKSRREASGREAGREQGSKHDSRTVEGKTSQKPVKQEKVFFDPKRIFQTKESSQQSGGTEEVGSRSQHAKEEAFISAQQVLNNGKPANPSKSSAAHKKPDYINNDLRDKRTNQTAAQNRESGGSGGRRRGGGRESHHQQNGAADRDRGRREGSTKEGKRESTAGSQHQQREEEENAGQVPLLDSIDWEAVEEWMTYVSEKVKTLVKSLSCTMITLSIYMLGIFMYLVSGGVHVLGLVWMKGLEEVKRRLFKSGFQEGKSGAKFPRTDAGRRRIGLEENIRLPVTGDEALHRLLACKGKDPYSILGLRSDASEEDIKRYYRKQAVLVHPDKNQEPGAEEAFKILGHAFEMIGEPAKRKLYDSQLKVETEAEAAMQEFADLLTKLQEKMQEAANMMRCDNCGGKHKRVPVDRPWYHARYCDKCNCRHQAKEGDMWAETSMLGFLWHYYALMDGRVYDITEWVACRKEFFKHMQANAHAIYFRLATEGNRGRHNRTNSGEPDIEDLINHLFQKTGMQPDGSWQAPQPPGGGAHPPSGGMPNKRTRRRKKKH